jgi:hypothetical protein
MLSDLLLLVRTKLEADLLCRELECLEEALFMTDTGGWNEILRTKVRLSVAEIISYEFPQDIEGRRKQLRELKESLLNLPVVNLTLAIEPTLDLVTELSNHLRDAVNAEIILDIQSDSLIVGGAVITFQGRFGDYSAASKMERAWNENSANLISIAYGNK